MRIVYALIVLLAAFGLSGHCVERAAQHERAAKAELKVKSAMERLRSREKQKQEAAAVFEAARKNPRDKVAILQRGNQNNLDGKYDDALADYLYAIKLDPNYASAWMMLGSTKADIGKLDEALADLNHAIKLSPDFAYAYNNLGTVLQQKKDVKGAIAAYSKCLELEPTCAIGFLNRGYALLGCGERQLALSDFNKFIELAKTDPRGYNARGDLYFDSQKFAKAAEDYAVAIALCDSSHDPAYLSNLYFNCAITASKLGKPADAIRDFDRALPFSKDPGKVYYLRAREKVSLRRLQDALDDLNEAVKRAARKGKIYLTRANVFSEIGNLRSAETDFATAISLGEEFHGYLDRSFVRMTFSDYDGALADATRVIEISPGSPSGYAAKGFAQYHLKDLRAAIDNFSVAIEHDSTRYSCYFVRGLIRDAIGEHEDAVKDLDKAIKLADDEEIVADCLSYKAGIRLHLGDLNGGVRDALVAFRCAPNVVAGHLRKSLRDEFWKLFTKKSG